MSSEEPEKQWIRDYQRGDTAALERLVEHYRRPLFAFILNMMDGRGDAEEIFQEVWLRAIRNVSKYREKNFIGWLFRIARNYFIDQVRRQKKFASESDISDHADHLSDLRPDPSHSAGARDLGHRIREALRSLPIEQREVFLMRSEADLSFKQIASRQGTTVNTALSRMNYAVQKLRPLLLEDYQSLSSR